MVLCQKTKFDQKNRILIPKEYIRVAGGEENGPCYVTCNEETGEIKIIIGRSVKRNGKQAHSGSHKPR